MLAFARARELMGTERVALDVPSGGTLRDVWTQLLARFPDLAPIAAVTRLARNGRLDSLDATLDEGDELALLPPVGGG